MYSILRNGLRDLSNSHLMSTGAAYGAGIYLSTAFGTAAGYSQSVSYYRYNNSMNLNVANMQRVDQSIQLPQ